MRIQLSKCTCLNKHTEKELLNIGNKKSLHHLQLEPESCIYFLLPYTCENSKMEQEVTSLFFNLLITQRLFPNSRDSGHDGVRGTIHGREQTG